MTEPWLSVVLTEGVELVTTRGRSPNMADSLRNQGIRREGLHVVLTRKPGGLRVGRKDDFSKYIIAMHVLSLLQFHRERELGRLEACGKIEDGEDMRLAEEPHLEGGCGGDILASTTRVGSLVQGTVVLTWDEDRCLRIHLGDVVFVGLRFVLLMFGLMVWCRSWV